MKVIFTHVKPEIYQYKVAKAFREKGIKTTSISLKEFDYEAFKDSFDEIICLGPKDLKPKTVFVKFFKNPLHFLKFFCKVLTIKADAVICQGAPHYLTAIFIRLFRKKMITMYYPYDFNFSRFKNTRNYFSKEEIWGEKDSFKNCDGIIYKSHISEFDLLPLGEIDVRNKPKLQFRCYAKKDLFVTPDPKKKLSYGTNEVHLVNAGSYLQGSDLYRPHCEHFYHILKQGFHLHFYTAYTGLTKKDIEDITKGEKELKKRLHPHPFVPMGKFSEELVKYDYGINIIYFSDVCKDRAKEIVGTTKVGQYLEAGLPIIINKHISLFADIIKRNGIGIVVDDWDLKDLKSKIKKANHKKLEKNVLEFRERHLMEEKITKLIKFIQELKRNKK